MSTTPLAVETSEMFPRMRHKSLSQSSRSFRNVMARRLLDRHRSPMISLMHPSWIVRHLGISSMKHHLKRILIDMSEVLREGWKRQDPDVRSWL